jgi:hypothetical protein
MNPWLLESGRNNRRSDLERGFSCRRDRERSVCVSDWPQCRESARMHLRGGCRSSREFCHRECVLPVRWRLLPRDAVSGSPEQHHYSWLTQLRSAGFFPSCADQGDGRDRGDRHGGDPDHGRRRLGAVDLRRCGRLRCPRPAPTDSSVACVTPPVVADGVAVDGMDGRYSSRWGAREWIRP